MKSFITIILLSLSFTLAQAGEPEVLKAAKGSTETGLKVSLDVESVASTIGGYDIQLQRNIVTIRPASIVAQWYKITFSKDTYIEDVKVYSQRLGVKRVKIGSRHPGQFQVPEGTTTITIQNISTHKLSTYKIKK